jgi:hypothetical protein
MGSRWVQDGRKKREIDAEKEAGMSSKCKMCCLHTSVLEKVSAFCTKSTMTLSAFVRAAGLELVLGALG